MEEGNADVHTEAMKHAHYISPIESIQYWKDNLAVKQLLV